MKRREKKNWKTVTVAQIPWKFSWMHHLGHGHRLFSTYDSGTLFCDFLGLWIACIVLDMMINKCSTKYVKFWINRCLINIYIYWECEWKREGTKQSHHLKGRSGTSDFLFGVYCLLFTASWDSLTVGYSPRAVPARWAGKCFYFSEGKMKCEVWLLLCHTNDSPLTTLYLFLRYEYNANIPEKLAIYSLKWIPMILVYLLQAVSNILNEKPIRRK